MKTLPCGRTIPAHSLWKPSEDDFSNWEARLRKYLRSQNLKYTQQRWEIAKLILSSGRHLSAPEIVNRVKKAAPGIGPATVYRSLKVLCDAEILVQSLHGKDGLTIYELPGDDHHDHIICQDCNEIFEFHDKQIEDRQTQVSESMGFAVAGHRHVIYVKCPLYQNSL